MTQEQKIAIARLKNSICVNTDALLTMQRDFFRTKSNALMKDCQRLEHRLRRQLQELEDLTGIKLKDYYRP